MKKRTIYWAIMCTFMAIITIICGLTIVHSSKVATLTLDQTVTYNPPTNIPVTLYANGGTFGEAESRETVIKLSDVLGNSDILSNPPTRTGYTLSGWKYSKDNTTYYSYDSSTEFPFTDHLYLQAQWTASNYTVTLNMQSGSGGSSSVSAIYGSSMPSATMPARTGYRFGGYYDQTGGSGKQYYTSSGASANTWDKASPTTLYAKWTANTYYVRFNKNNNDATGEMSNQTFTYGTAQTLTANEFTLEGYTFAGWATSSNGSKAYDDEESVSDLASTHNATVDLYALWEEEADYTITVTFGSGNLIYFGYKYDTVNGNDGWEYLVNSDGNGDKTSREFSTADIPQGKNLYLIVSFYNASYAYNITSGSGNADLYKWEWGHEPQSWGFRITNIKGNITINLSASGTADFPWMW